MSVTPKLGKHVHGKRIANSSNILVCGVVAAIFCKHGCGVADGRLARHLFRKRRPDIGCHLLGAGLCRDPRPFAISGRPGPGPGPATPNCHSDTIAPYHPDDGLLIAIH